MKKIIVWLFAVMLCFTYASAEGKYDKEIFFRNIPWGISMIEAYEILADSNLSFGKPKEGRSGFNYLSVEGIIEGHPSNDSDFPTEIEIKSKTPLIVAGFDVKETDLIFAYLIDDNGRISKEQKNTSLILACYVIEVIDLKEASDIMKEKLCSLYGDIDSIHDNSIDGVMDRLFYYWYAQNNSFVCLETNDNGGIISPVINVYYGTYQGDSLMETANIIQKELAIDEMKTRTEKGGTDGL